MSKQKERRFRAALIRVIEAADSPDYLERSAAALLRQAGSGNVHAIKELADRLDGKALQETTTETTIRYVIEVPADLTGEEWERKYGNKAEGETIQ